MHEAHPSRATIQQLLETITWTSILLSTSRSLRKRMQLHYGIQIIRRKIHSRVMVQAQQLNHFNYGRSHIGLCTCKMWTTKVLWLLAHAKRIIVITGSPKGRQISLLTCISLTLSVSKHKTFFGDYKNISIVQDAKCC